MRRCGKEAEPLQVRRSLGALPDARGIYKRLTARENIEYFAALQGMAPAAARERCSQLLAALDMNAIADRRSEGYSQGERVKTAIARALVHDPRNVLLDEPTNGLDVASTRALREFLRELKAAGRCVLLSTHLMQEVAALCDRIVILGAGLACALLATMLSVHSLYAGDASDGSLEQMLLSPQPAASASR